ncbi:hypothetical protein [uncultured Aquimarina sp.]|uniref:hypothetical protein n=1 Tax=uncultured Aquimarina sp. TaxID=575652 RepID=UPI00261C01C5|nr:hypothetical protein [uncultured Aquimarina sp.]
MKRLLNILVVFIIFIGCKQTSKADTVAEVENVSQTPFQTFINSLPSTELPLNHSSYEYLFTKEQSDWDNNLFLFKINLSKLNKELIIYESKSYDFESLQNSKKYSVGDFLKKYPGRNMEDYALEKYRDEAVNANDNVFFNIPILKFSINDTYIIGFLTVVASENDNAFAAIRLQTYTKQGKLMISNDRKLKNGLTLIYGFSSEDGAVNIFSTISKNGSVERKRIFVSEEKLERITKYQVSAKGFIPLD